MLSKRQNAAMHVPTSPGTYRFTPTLGEPFDVEVVQYKEALMARLRDQDEPELHPVGDMDGTWS
jgi:hypothetical protein